MYAQIVRISYLEGDVRIARGAEAEKQRGAAWEKAVAGIQLETGYSLATGAGRVEIEFEDASTVYLADNSVLTFSDLRTVGGVPHTELSLPAGTATMHVRPQPAESFVLKTPTDGLTTAYPAKAYLRITAYTDAIAITPQKDESYQLDAPGSAAQKSAKGQTQLFDNGKALTLPAQSEADDFTAWDSWVAGRVTQRSAAMKAAMKAAGLDTPLPGLADLNGRGTFSPCAPYGTCWDPPADANQQPTASQAPGTTQQPDFSLALSSAVISLKAGQQIPVSLSVTDLNGFTGAIDLTASLPDGFICPSCSGHIAQGQALASLLMADLTVPEGTYSIPFTATSGTLSHQISLTVIVFTTSKPTSSESVEAAVAFDVAAGSPIFPCFPAGVAMMAAGDIRIGKGTYLVPVSDPPYAWAVCHAGSWIFKENHYVWVVSRRRHHHPPIHWIKEKHSTGYVPIHPRDVKGKPPVNRKHDVYALSDKKGQTVERTQFDPKGKIAVMKEPPKEFRTDPLRRLDTAADPRIMTRAVLDKQPGIALTFDRNSRSFVAEKPLPGGDGKQQPIKAPTERGGNLRTGADGNVFARGNSGSHTGAQPTHTATHVAAKGTHGTAGAPKGGSHAGGGAHGGGHSGGGHAGGGHGGGHH